MAIKLYGAVGSTATFRALAALYEKEVEFELVTLSFEKGEHKSPSLLVHNPFGQVPIFQYADLTLFESRAITKYVAEVYADKGTCLILKDPKKSAIQSVWMEVENQKFDSTTLKLAFELVFKPMFGQETDEAVVTEFEKKLEDLLDVYEKRLTESKYLGGDSFTLADLHHMPNLFYLMSSRAKKSFDARPHVSAWAADILSRPSWVKVISMLPK